MSDDASKKYSEKVQELSDQIYLMKMRLIAKYGPSVKRFWE